MVVVSIGDRALIELDPRSGHRREKGRRLDANGIHDYFGEWTETHAGTTTRLVHGPGADNVLAEVTAEGSVRTLSRDGTANVTHVALDGVPEAMWPEP